MDHPVGILLVLSVFASVTIHGQVLTSNLPIMVINTHGQEIGDDPKIPADMSIVYNGPGKTNTDIDTVFDFNGKIGIEFRGSSSQQWDKKPYAIEIQDGAGNSIDAPLLGMPAKDDWVMDAMYDDKTLMRNVLAYKLGRAMGRYASRTRYVELVLNGFYIGLYSLQEKVKRDKYRVDISKLNPTETDGDDVTGGYIIKIDKTTGSGGDGWQSAYLPDGGGSPINFLYDYPKSEDIVPAQKQYIQNYVLSFESALTANTFLDPVIGYTKYIDVASFIDFFLMQEVTKNPDGYRLSTYFSKQKDSKGGKISMGPIWDFNEGFGNVDYCTQGNPEGLAVAFNTICPDDFYQIPFWWNRLFQDINFKQAVSARWTQLRAGPFQTAGILNSVDSIAAELNVGARQRNFNLWPVIGTYVWPNYYVELSYPDGILWVKNWITDRFDWLDKNLPGPITLGVKDDPSFAVSVYPNPFSRDLTAEIAIEQPGDVEIDLYDLMGRKVESSHQSFETPGKYPVTLQSPAQSGVYYLRARSGDQTRVIKLVRKN